MDRQKNVIPEHVAIVPDGNRRWAKDHGLSVYQGHKRGIGAFEKIANHAADRGVTYLSLWGLSADNFHKRSKREVADLLRIFRSEFIRLAKLDSIHRRRTRINVFGRWDELFPLPVKRAIKAAVLATAGYDNNFLNFFIAYNGIDEMLRAVRKITRQAKRGPVRVTESLIKHNLYTKDLPPVDLVIRTAGEPHLSAGFMMWDTANAELYFSSKYWPAFKKQDLDRALEYYEKRERRLGS